MTLSNFISRLNWRLIVTHFIACWLFIYSFEQFSYLHDIEFWTTILTHSRSWLENPRNWNFGAGRLSLNLLWLGLSGFVGFLIAFAISLTITIKKDWFWVNSLIVFLVGCVLGLSDSLGWRYLKTIFLAPGRLFNSNTILYVIANGIVMLTLGLLLFFLNGMQRFVRPKIIPGTIEEISTE